MVARNLTELDLTGPSMARRQDGDRWYNDHIDYFSDPDVARPYIGAIIDIMVSQRPNVLADIGGGSGSITSQLAERDAWKKVRFMNLDLSYENGHISRGEGPFSSCGYRAELKREELVEEGQRLMMINRSPLQTLGVDNQRPFISRIRRLMRPGEAIVMQVSCFDSEEAKDCMNTIQSLMGTGDWYPTRSLVESMMNASDWEVLGWNDSPPMENQVRGPEGTVRTELS